MLRNAHGASARLACLSSRCCAGWLTGWAVAGERWPSRPSFKCATASSDVMRIAAMTLPMPPKAVTDLLKRGIVIPAHPLALDAQRKLDVRRQRALSRYYLAAGAGGLAVGVHTTQFEIRQHGLFEPVLQLAADTMREVEQRTGRTVVKVAGVIGPTTQAVAEARQARELGYHAGLLSLAALKTATDKELIA